MKTYRMMVCFLVCGVFAMSCEFLSQTAQEQGVITKDQADGATGVYKGAKELSSETSLKDERDLGETVALQAYATTGFGAPLKNEYAMRYVAMMTTLVGRYSERPLIPYFTAIINSDEVNAFATPGGYIFITRGAIEMMQSEAELASVIGHEVAHINKKHALNEIKRVKGWSQIGSGAAKGAGVGGGADFDALVKDLAKMIMGKAFSKTDELDADLSGMKYTMAAGYDPRAMLDFLTTLKSKSAPSGAVVSSHPEPHERIDELNKFFRTIPDEDWRGLVKNTNRFAKFKEELKKSQSW